MEFDTSSPQLMRKSMKHHLTRRFIIDFLEKNADDGGVWAYKINTIYIKDHLKIPDCEETRKRREYTFTSSILRQMKKEGLLKCREEKDPLRNIPKKYYSIKNKK